MHNIMLDGKLTMIKDHENPVDANNLSLLYKKRNSLKYNDKD